MELLSGAVGLVPTQRAAKVVEASVTWNYTTILNLVFLTLAAVLVVRFLSHRRTSHAEDDEWPSGPRWVRRLGRDEQHEITPACSHRHRSRRVRGSCPPTPRRPCQGSRRAWTGVGR
jgi:hypothetical protein